MYRTVFMCLLCGLLAAQQPSTVPPAQTPEAGQQDPVIRVGVDYVTTPALVFDRDGGYVNGLRPDQFRLFDNGKEQNINVEVVFVPISVVILVQSNSNVQGLLTQVKKIGNLVQPLLIGDQGRAAVIAYDSRIRTLQDFTSDPDLITKATAKITPGSYSNRLIDAVSEATLLLRRQPKDRRRIILVIGETRDNGSETRLREALIELQLNNISVYGVDMSRFMTTLMAPPPVPRPDNRPASAHQLPGGVPSTPTTVAQTYGQNGGRAEFLPLMVELFRDAKAIFKDNPIEAFTKGTGGSEFGFHSQRTLEEAVQHLGEELHSQYFISYSPNNRDEAGFHEIKVLVPGRPEVKRVQTRPGYWLGPKQELPK